MAEDESTSGHRKRLREKFLKSGLAGFHDYEIVELLLTLGTPRRDCKEQAKEAIRRFKNLRGVLEAPSEELQQIKGIGTHSIFGLKLVQEVAREYLKERIIDKPVRSSAEDVFKFLYHTMRDLKKEIFSVIYLNSQNQIIDVVELVKGTVNSAAIAPREVIEGAIKHHAVALIFVHNHPSGSIEPSDSDKDITRELVYAANIMQLRVLDHLIIGENRYYRFASEGLIEEYQMNYLHLKQQSTSESSQRTRFHNSSGKTGDLWKDIQRQP